MERRHLARGSRAHLEGDTVGIRSSKRRRRVVALAVGSVAAFACSAGAAWALPPFTFGQKTSPATGGQTENYLITAACHPTYDRFVVRFRFGGTPGYRIRYAGQIHQDGSGLPVTLLGSKKLLVVFDNARAHTADGSRSLVPSVLNPLCPNLRQVKLAGDFEGVVTYGLGLRTKGALRVFRLTSPKRVVIDVHH
jgi:hypothetical protein